ELESQSDLHLPLAIERAARFVESSEGGVIVQRRSVQRVNRRVDPGELGAVEEVENFAQELEVHLLFDVKPPGKPQVEVLHARPGEGVSPYQREAVGAAARAVEAPGRCIGQTAGDQSIVRKPGIKLEDRRYRPTVNQRLYEMAVSLQPWRVNGADYKFVTSVESRSAAFSFRIEDIERHVPRRDGLGGLTIINRLRYSVAAQKLKSAGESAIGLQHHRVIFRLDGARNLGQLRISGIRARATKDRDGERLTVKRPARNREGLIVDWNIQ